MTLIVVVLAAAVSGVALAAWALFWDRARGRKRCAGCWYDMGAVVGLTCPECGREAKGERGLLRTRRRWRVAALVVAVGVVGAGVPIGKRMYEHGWAAGLPEWMLVRFLKPVGEERDATRAVHWASLEVRRRFREDEISAWAIGEAFERQQVARTVEEWPEGWEILVAGQLPEWTGWPPPGLSTGFVTLHPTPEKFRRSDWIRPCGTAKLGMNAVEVSLGVPFVVDDSVGRVFRLPVRVRPEVPADLGPAFGPVLRDAIVWRAAEYRASRGVAVEWLVAWGPLGVGQDAVIVLTISIETPEGSTLLGRADRRPGEVVTGGTLTMPHRPGAHTASWRVVVRGADAGTRAWPGLGPWVGEISFSYDELMKQVHQW